MLVDVEEGIRVTEAQVGLSQRWRSMLPRILIRHIVTEVISPIPVQAHCRPRTTSTYRLAAEATFATCKEGSLAEG